MPEFTESGVVASVTKLEITMLEAMRDFDTATELVNDDDWVVSRKGKFDSVISGAIDLSVSRGLSSRSLDDFSGYVISKSCL
jgi:hypothetical protein